VSIPIALGLMIIGAACLAFGWNEWRQRDEETEEWDFLTGRRGHRSNAWRVRVNAVAFVVIGAVLIGTAIGGLI